MSSSVEVLGSVSSRLEGRPWCMLTVLLSAPVLPAFLSPESLSYDVRKATVLFPLLSLPPCMILINACGSLNSEFYAFLFFLSVFP